MPTISNLPLFEFFGGWFLQNVCLRGAFKGYPENSEACLHLSHCAGAVGANLEAANYHFFCDNLQIRVTGVACGCEAGREAGHRVPENGQAGATLPSAFIPISTIAVQDAFIE